MTDESLIELDGVTKRYGETVAISDLSIDVTAGSFHGIVGPNGSGKTTLFRLIGGITNPTAGTITKRTDSIGFGFQRPQLYSDLTVEENLDVFASLGSSDSEWIATIIDRLSLESVRSRPSRSLSGGYRKRVDIAIAVVQRPTCLVLDEPFADIDEPSRRSIGSFLSEYQSGERTVVVSTHQFDAFDGEFSRVSVLNDGKLVRDQSTETVPITSVIDDVFD